MEKITTEQIGVIVLKDNNGKLIGLIYKDPTLQNKNIFYSCTEMSFSDLEGLFKRDFEIKS